MQRQDNCGRTYFFSPRLLSSAKLLPRCLLGARLEAFLGNVSLLSAVVAALVAGRLGAIGGDVPSPTMGRRSDG